MAGCRHAVRSELHVLGGYRHGRLASSHLVRLNTPPPPPPPTPRTHTHTHHPQVFAGRHLVLPAPLLLCSLQKTMWRSFIEKGTVESTLESMQKWQQMVGGGACGWKCLCGLGLGLEGARGRRAYGCRAPCSTTSERLRPTGHLISPLPACPAPGEREAGSGAGAEAGALHHRRGRVDGAVWGVRRQHKGGGGGYLQRLWAALRLRRVIPATCLLLRPACSDA